MQKRETRKKNHLQASFSTFMERIFLKMNEKKNKIGEKEKKKFTIIVKKNFHIYSHISHAEFKK